MHEQRIQAYLQLIQTLMNSPNGTEKEILANHSELVDAGLIQIIEAVAARMTQRGNNNTAHRLQNLAQQLKQALTQTATHQDNQDNRQQAYLHVFEALLQGSKQEKEEEILNANRNLVDAGLVQTINQVASQLKERGASNEAKCIIK